MARKLHYHRVDVFTNEPFGGNPLAVFTNGRGLSTEIMQPAIETQARSTVPTPTL